jgi:hypothetical protein
MNPLLTDSKGQRAHHLTTNPAIRDTLVKYIEHAPCREVMRWYGPFVTRRVFEFLLVVQRWRCAGPVWLPKDVVNLITRYVMASERASVVKQPESEPTGLSLWTQLRAGECRVPGAFEAMAHIKDIQLWHWIGLELLTMRHPDEHSTLMHVAARTNNAVAVRELMLIWMNPLLRDSNGQLPMDVTCNDWIRTELLRYMRQAPRIEVMRWYGPFLMQRVRAFLLVARRWRNVRLRVLPTSVVHTIIGHVRDMEYV